MKDRFYKLGLLFFFTCVFGMQDTKAQNTSGKWELGFYGGALLADKEVGRGRNAAGGQREQLIGRLDSGGSVGLQFGRHSDLLGLEANLLSGARTVGVKNEFGVDFPNHGEQPVIYSGDILIYPFRTLLFGGRLRPYLTTGVGGALMAIDLDNINNKENHNALTWNAGVGMKYLFGKEQNYFADFRLRNHRLSDKTPLHTINLQSVAVGFGVRY